MAFGFTRAGLKTLVIAAPGRLRSASYGRRRPRRAGGPKVERLAVPAQRSRSSVRIDQSSVAKPVDEERRRRFQDEMLRFEPGDVALARPRDGGFRGNAGRRASCAGRAGRILRHEVQAGAPADRWRTSSKARSPCSTRQTSRVEQRIALRIAVADPQAGSARGAARQGDAACARRPSSSPAPKRSGRRSTRQIHGLAAAPRRRSSPRTAARKPSRSAPLARSMRIVRHREQGRAARHAAAIRLRRSAAVA